MGKLYVVGIGNGNHDSLTIKADKVLTLSDFIYCDEKIYPMLSNYYDISKIIKNTYTKTEERVLKAIASAKNNVVSLIGSGDTGIYGVAPVVFKTLDMNDINIDVEIIPGITSLVSGSALLGSPLSKDFVVISLSDNFIESDYTFERIKMASCLDLGIVFYSPCNPTIDNLKKAREVLLKYKSEDTTVGIVKNIDSPLQKVDIVSLKNVDLKDIDSNTTIFIGRSDTEIINQKKKTMFTPLY